MPENKHKFLKYHDLSKHLDKRLIPILYRETTMQNKPLGEKLLLRKRRQITPQNPRVLE